MKLGLGLGLGTDAPAMGSKTELGQLAQTIMNIAENHGKPPETEIFEPYSERMITVAEYMPPFRNEKTGVSGYKIDQDVLPLDVLGIYLIKARRADQIQVVFEQRIDIKAVGEVLQANPETEKLEVRGKCIKEGARVLAIMDGQKLIVITGKTNPAFAKVLATVETIYHSGAFIEDTDTETDANRTNWGVGVTSAPSGKPRMKLEQKLDVRVEARVTTIQTIEGTLRPELRTEQRQMLAMRMAPLMKASADEVQDALEDQTEEVKRQYNAAMRQLAGRIMREAPANVRPRNFGVAMKLAHRMVQSGLKRQASGR